MFEFPRKRGYDRVLLGAPWSFDKNLLLIQPYNGKQKPIDLIFSHVAFWVRVMDIPPILMTKFWGENIGHMVEEVLEVADISKKLVSDACLRVKIKIDINKPLRKGFFLSNLTGTKIRSGSISNMRSCQIFVMCVAS